MKDEGGRMNQDRVFTSSLILHPSSLSLKCARASQFAQARGKFGDRNRAGIAFDAVAHCDLAGCGFTLADDEHEGDLLKLRVTNLRANLFAAQIGVNAEARSLQLFFDLDGPVV